MNDLRLTNFTINVAVLEPYTDLSLRSDDESEILYLKDLIFQAVGEIIDERAGRMRGLAQVSLGNISTKHVPSLVAEEPNAN